MNTGGQKDEQVKRLNWVWVLKLTKMSSKIAAFSAKINTLISGQNMPKIVLLPVQPVPSGCKFPGFFIQTNSDLVLPNKSTLNL